MNFVLSLAFLASHALIRNRISSSKQEPNKGNEEIIGNEEMSIERRWNHRRSNYLRLVSKRSSATANQDDGMNGGSQKKAFLHPTQMRNGDVFICETRVFYRRKRPKPFLSRIDRSAKICEYALCNFRERSKMITLYYYEFGLGPFFIDLDRWRHLMRKNSSWPIRSVGRSQGEREKGFMLSSWAGNFSRPALIRISFKAKSFLKSFR